MAQNNLKAKLILVFLPNGKAVEIRPEDALIEFDRETKLVRAVTERMKDGSCRRYEGFPVMIETHPPSLVETVPVMPPGLVGGH